MLKAESTTLMKPCILVVSNHRLSSLGYVAALNGYGYHVHDVQTFSGARILLRTGVQPHIVIVDMKFHTAENDACIEEICHAHPQAFIIVISADSQALYAHQVLPRPVELNTLLDVLQHA